MKIRSSSPHMCDPVADGRGTQQGRRANPLAIVAFPTQKYVRKSPRCSSLQRRCSFLDCPYSLAQTPSRCARVNMTAGIESCRHVQHLSSVIVVLTTKLGSRLCRVGVEFHIFIHGESQCYCSWFRCRLLGIFIDEYLVCLRIPCYLRGG